MRSVLSEGSTRPFVVEIGVGSYRSLPCSNHCPHQTPSPKGQRLSAPLIYPYPPREFHCSCHGLYNEWLPAFCSQTEHLKAMLWSLACFTSKGSYNPIIISCQSQINAAGNCLSWINHENQQFRLLIRTGNEPWTQYDLGCYQFGPVLWGWFLCVLCGVVWP